MNRTDPKTKLACTTDTTSSVDVIALFFGAKAIDTFDADLGQTKLSIVNAPTFSNPTLTLDVTLTFPTDLINGLDRSYNLTCGEFFTLGVSHSYCKEITNIACYVDELLCEAGGEHALYFHLRGTGVCCLGLIQRTGIKE
jgi:hypothetical protein